MHSNDDIYDLYRIKLRIIRIISIENWNKLDNVNTFLHLIEIVLNSKKRKNYQNLKNVYDG